jgi:hypothetical protein
MLTFGEMILNLMECWCRLHLSGVDAFHNSFYGKAETKTMSKKAVGIFATLTVIVALVIGFNKSLLHKQDKNSAHEYNKAKTSEASPKATAFLDDNDK